MSEDNGIKRSREALIGHPCRMSDRYCNQLKRADQTKARQNKRGYIVSFPDSWTVRVKWDDVKAPLSYHVTCIAPDYEAAEKTVRRLELLQDCE